jgi:hypothetical protein
MSPVTRDRAQLALERGNHAGAIAELLLAAGRCPSGAGEREALLTAAALALDPSNALRQVDLAASLSARYLATAQRGDAGRPLAQSLYLLALELGGERVTSAGCGGGDSVLAALPRVSAPAGGASSNAPELDRIKILERELARLRDELVRIRKTLEPSQ